MTDRLHGPSAGLVVAILAAIGLGLAGCEERDPFTYQGYAEGEYVRVAVPEAGILEALYVERGAMVAVGDPLFALERARESAVRDEAAARVAQARAELDNLSTGSRASEIAMLEAELDGARAELHLARTHLGRQQELEQREFASTRSLDEARTGVNRWAARVAEIEAHVETALLGGRTDEVIAAQAAVAAGEAVLAQAIWHIERRTPEAVSAARVEDTLYRPGEFVPAGRPVVTLLPPENVLVRFFVPEPELGAVQYGQAVILRCDGCPDEIPGHVTFIANEAEFTPPVIYSSDSRAKLVFLVEAHPDDLNSGLTLHPGQPIDVELQR